MAPMISRRQFLRGDVCGRKPAVRPPWALDEAAFLSACTRCDKCAPACPEKIIVIERGYPTVDFSRGECTFCAACVTACPSGALKKHTEDQRPWQLHAQIGASCMAFGNAICRICGDACPSMAIRFRPRIGAAAVPEVIEDKCTGCGACVAPCPVTAIAVV